MLAEARQPSDEIRAKGARRDLYIQFMTRHFEINSKKFQIKLGKAPSVHPIACLSTGCCVCTGFPAWYWRKQTLEAYAANKEDYIKDFKCFQGYVTEICGYNLQNFDQQEQCFILESLCFPVCSINSTRLYIMEQESIHPDELDFQLINCSNTFNICCPCTKLTNGRCPDVVSIGDCVTDAYTLSIAGNMGAQIKAELNHKANIIPNEVEIFDSEVDSDDDDKMDLRIPDYMTIERDMAEEKVIKTTKPSGNFMEIEVPKDSQPGSALIISCPNGQQRFIKIPPDVTPGTTLVVSY